ncbi:MAG: DNA-binding protein [Gammaproteobacteria bacterium]
MGMPVINSYEFSLKFSVTATSEDIDAWVERLGAEGCDDALIGTGRPGRIALDFTRRAPSAQVAVLSALADVRRALPGAKLLEVGPDFVGLSDIAELVGVSRQNLRKLSLAHAGSFPAAVHDGNPAIWHLAPVLQWLQLRQGYRIDPNLLEVAKIAMRLNIAKEAAALSAAVQRRLRPLVA